MRGTAAGQILEGMDITFLGAAAAAVGMVLVGVMAVVPLAMEIGAAGPGVAHGGRGRRGAGLAGRRRWTRAA